MSTAAGSPPEQPAAEAGASPAAEAAEAAEAAPPPAAADAAAPAAAAAPDAGAQLSTPADAIEKLADLEKNWVGILERVTVHVDAAEERLQCQLAEEAEPGWQPARYKCSGADRTARGSVAAAALSWWQHSDRCLNAAVGRGEDLETLKIYQATMRGVLERIHRKQAAATARLAAAEAGGQRAEGAAGASTSASTSASTACPAPTRSELAKLKWLLGGLAAAAARMDALVDRTTAMAAQTQELADAAKKTAADRLAVYLHQALEGEAVRQRRQEQAAAVPPLAPPAGGFGLGAAAPLAGVGARPAAGFGGFGARPHGGFGGYGAQRFGGYAAGAGAQYAGGFGLGQAPAGRPGAGLFDQLLQQQAGVGQAVDQVGARLNQFAQQLEQQLGQQGRLGQQLAQVRAAAAGLQRRPAVEERPPEWAPPEQRQQAEAEHSRRARLRAMLETEQEEGEGEAEPGSASQEGGDGEAAGEQQEQQEQEGSSAAAELAAEPSVLSCLSASPGGSEAAESHGGKEQAEEGPTDEEKEWAVLMNATREMEEGQQARAAQGATPVVQPVAAAQAGATAAEVPAAGGPAATAGADQLTAQQRQYIAAQRRRFAEAKQAGEAPPPAVHASPSPPPAPRPASWQPHLPLAPRSVLPPVVEAARATQQGAKGRAAFGLENSNHAGTGSGKAGGPGRPSTLPLSANRAAGAAAIARAEALDAWQVGSRQVNGTPDNNELLAQHKASSGHRFKLRFVRRLFPGLSCFLPEEAKD